MSSENFKEDENSKEKRSEKTKTQKTHQSLYRAKKSLALTDQRLRNILCSTEFPRG